jgi:hypothetical protein
VNRGQYRIIRVDGSEEMVPKRPTLDAIYKAIGCDTIDTVTLDRDRQLIMMVDDEGILNGKPINPKASALMKEAFGPSYPNPICGDVALVNDEDFA